MKSLKKNLVRLASVAIVLVIIMSTASQACSSRRTQARDVIRKTAYTINEAYDMVSYYDYWSGSSLSKAVYYNDYAQDLYRSRRYSNAINYSLLARQYAVDVINSCDDYWESFFYTYFGWSYAYGYNSRYSNAYAAGYRDGYYDAYYRAYCNRHDHYDQRHNPYGHNQHRNASDYNDHNNGHNNGNVTIGRGEIGATGNGSASSKPGRQNTGSNTSIFKDISTNQYFDASELKLVKALPSETALESDFKTKNPGKAFDDTKLAKDTKAIETNRTAAKEFKPSSSKNNGKIELAKPTTVVSERPQQPVVTPSKELPAKKEQPDTKVTQPVLNEKPVLLDSKPEQKVEPKQPAKPAVTPTKTAPKQAVKKVEPTKQPTPAKQTPTQQTPAKKESTTTTTTAKEQPAAKQSKPATTKQATPATTKTPAKRTTK
ncbi:MAG: hypothetical protein LBO06_02725 [Bacteroidales bacterium]|jgi:hypothetical protein|nr:hypothetical protein [Bacteroidales bacterium]